MSQPSDPTLTLTLVGGRLNVSGNVIQNKVVAYGMLVMAEEAIRDWHVAQASGPKLAVPTLSIPREVLNGS